MRFIGVDLAWGGTNPSGLAALDERGCVVAEGLGTSDDEIAAFVSGHDRDGAVLAIDGPLVVDNPTGRRACEAELQRRYGRLGAGPYPSNLERPYLTAPVDPRRAPRGWWAVEVFPHPALVELGGLARALRYKKGPVAARVDGLRRLHAVLAGLEAATPPLRLRPDGRLAAELARLDSLRGRARKGFEDLADAHVCWCWWWHGRWRTLVAGDERHGAILVPLAGGGVDDHLDASG
jgi:predicted RNase H-like nuclease